MPVYAAVWWVGAACIASACARLSWLYYFHFRRAPCDVAVRYGAAKGEPGWAIVTGGSSGIGFEMVAQLLAAGFSVGIVALPQEERALARRLRGKGFDLDGKRCFFVGVDAADGASAATEAHDEISERVGDGGVRVLAHCIGGPKPVPTPLSGHSENDVQALVNVNLTFAVALTTSCLGAMRESDGRKAVLFVSSQSGQLGAAPLVAVYAACKAALNSLAGSLRTELAYDGAAIDVVATTPGHTLSGSTLNWFGGEGWEPPGNFATPVQVAAGSLAALDCGSALVAPFWMHDLQHLAASALPTWLVGWLVYRELAPAMRSAADDADDE